MKDASILRIGSLCTGYGGLDLAAQAVFGGELAWWSDVEPGPIKVMQYHHPDLSNLGDLKAIEWDSVSPVDVLTAGYPCQPFSRAGKQLGIDDPRYVWPWIAYAVARLRPSVVVLENVSAHLQRLWPQGWAQHSDGSGRIDWQEYAPAIRRWERCLGRLAPAPSVLGPRGGIKVSPAFGEWLMGLPENYLTAVPDLTITQQLRLIGNGVVPQQAEHAIRMLLAQYEGVVWQ